MKVNVLYRISYGDFDIQQKEVVAVGNAELLKIRGAEMTSRLTEDEKSHEIGYKIGNEKIPLL